MPASPRPPEASHGRAELLTVGHGTLPADVFASLLAGAGVRRLVDVRRFPGSRRNPQYRREALEEWLPAAGIAYAWDPRLGGRRSPDPSSLNTALRDQGFRGYADHMATPEFALALEELLASAETDLSAVMCSEALWWRCHRRLIADAAVLLKAMPVAHLLQDGQVIPHAPTPGARVEGDRLLYTEPGLA